MNIMKKITNSHFPDGTPTKIYYPAPLYAVKFIALCCYSNTVIDCVLPYNFTQFLWNAECDIFSLSLCSSAQHPAFLRHSLLHHDWSGCQAIFLMDHHGNRWGKQENSLRGFMLSLGPLLPFVSKMGNYSHLHMLSMIKHCKMWLFVTK